MTNRIPIQQFQDIMKKKYPNNIKNNFIYDENKKEIKYISRVILNTIKEFSETLKYEQNNFILDLPKKDITYDDSEITKDYKEYNHDIQMLKYLKRIIKNFEFEKIHYLESKKIVDIKKYIYYHTSHKEHGLFGFIENNIDEWLYFLLLSIQNKNILVEKIISSVKNHDIIYKGIKYTKEDPLYEDILNYRSEKCNHKYTFNYNYFMDLEHCSKLLNEKRKKHINYIINQYSYLQDVKIDILLTEIIDNAKFTIEFINEHYKKYFSIIYNVYNILIKNVEDKKSFDKKIYKIIKYTLKNFL